MSGRYDQSEGQKLLFEDEVSTEAGQAHYAKTRLLKRHGISPQRFPLYLYEMQFRYNIRNEDLFDLMLDALIKPVPDLL